MIDKEIYEKGITCRGICCICNEKDGCYQYSINKPTERSELNMTGTEYCKSCEKSDVCMYTKDFVKVVDEANENVNKSSFNLFYIKHLTNKFKCVIINVVQNIAKFNT